MNKAIVGKKLGMSQVFAQDGQVIPVTVIEAGPCPVVHIKTEEKDGYNALQVAFDETEKINKPLLAEIQRVKSDAFRQYLADRYNERENIAAPYDPAIDLPEPKVDRHKHGKYGWVRLSDDEYSRLLSELGEEELQRCITYVDESAQSNGNRNKWKDWNLVVRKCSRDGWGKKGAVRGRESAGTVAMDDLRKVHDMLGEEVGL